MTPWAWASWRLPAWGLYVFAPQLMGIFTADAAVIALGIEAFAEPMFGASIVASGSMQGAGDSTGCFVLNLISMWGVRLTLAVLLAPALGWWAYGQPCAPNFVPAAHYFAAHGAWQMAG